MGLDRRAFIGLVAGGAVGAMVTPMPWWPVRDAAFWTQNWPWIPKVPQGEFKYVKTTSKLCPSGTGISVLTVGGLPVTAQGEKSHPLSKGGISAVGISEVYMLYSPSRVKKPLKKDGAKFSPISWDEALTLLSEKLKAAKSSVACICGDPTSSASEVFSALTAKLGSDKCFFMPGDAQTASKGWELMGGQGQVGYDIENSDCLVILNADVFDNWGTSIRNQKAVAAKGDREVVYVGPAQNGTSAVSKSWIPSLPGSEAAVALGLAYHLLKAGVSPAVDDLADFKSFVNANYSPDKVAKLTGISEQALADLAGKLKSAKAPLIICGGQGLGAGAFMAAMSLNLMLGRVGAVGGINALPELPKSVAGAMDRSKMFGADLAGYLNAISGGKQKAPEVLICQQANPAYALPQAKAFADVLASVPFKVSFTSFMDETAAMSDLVLPCSLTLERYDDLATPYGSGFALYSLAKPVIKPLFETKNAADAALALAKKLGLDLGFDSFEKILKDKAASLAKAGGFLAKDGDPCKIMAGKAQAPAAFSGDLWKALSDGAAWVSSATVKQNGLKFGAATLAKALAASPAEADYPLGVAVMTRLRTGTPVTGIPAQNLTCVPNSELLENDFLVSLNSATAKKYSLSEGDKVKVNGKKGECLAKVSVCETVAPDVVAIPAGFGHTAFDQFSQNKGDNVFKVLTLSEEAGTGLSVWGCSKVKIAKI